MKNQTSNNLVEQALSLSGARDKLVADLQDVLNGGRTIASDIAKWQTSQSLEDCVGCLPETTRPKIVTIPPVIVDIAETVLLQLNPLSRFALWVFSKKITTTRGQFRFKLGESFVSRQFSQVCWCDSCLSREDKQKIAPSLIELCREHGISTVFLRLGGCLNQLNKYTVNHGGRRLTLVDAHSCWEVRAFKEKEKADAQQCVFFGSVADESPLSKNIWLQTSASDVKIQDIWRVFVN